MNDSYNKQAFESEDDRREFDFTNRLVEDAREFFSTELENSPDEVCPHKIVLKQLLLSAKLPDEKQRKHLFSCSECFKEYHNALSVRQKNFSSVPSTPFWRNFSSLFKSNWIYAGLCASLLFFILIGAFFFFRRHTSSDSQPVISSNTRTQEKSKPQEQPKNHDNKEGENVSVEEKKSVNENVNKQPSPETAERSQSKSKGELLAHVTVTIDLSNKAVVRGGKGSEDEEAVSLAPKPTRLVLRLPDGSPKGNYKVSLMDAFGSELMSHRAFSKNGKTLITDFDFRSFASNKQRLCVARNGAIPECFLVAFENK